MWHGFGCVNTIPSKEFFLFQGKVLHTIDYCKLQKEETSQLLKGKKVAVIGFKKSAIDLALECADENQGIKISLSLSLSLYIYIK